MQYGNVKPFNIMNLPKTKKNKGGRRKKNKTKKSKIVSLISYVVTLSSKYNRLKINSIILL